MKLIKLIETAQKQNKFVEIVGPIGAVNFLMGLCDRLGMDPPEPIPFGIKSKQVEILDNYLGFYRRARQKPPIKEDKNIYINVLDDLLKLQEKLKSPGIIWLMGPPGSGKSSLIGEIYNSLNDKNKLFYFSPIFSRKPISCMVALSDGQLVGFSCHDSTCRNFFGPIGTDPRFRRKGVGKALLLVTLEAMAHRGYAYAVIGNAGPKGFFEKCVGAMIIPGSTPGIYRPSRIRTLDDNATAGPKPISSENE